ncbi:MAG: 16S rRNA (cytosine(1402)-N(4))-methyltransferase RsmH [Planctomycetes bacterium]|nr:16S rRNA (cytosine(1402)-N(4))-methyltransferase RsmH [Planctomycetota bacterium]
MARCAYDLTKFPLAPCREIPLPPSTCHIPVLLDEVIQWLEPAAGKIIVDGTLGGGGHSAALASRVLPGGKIIGVDLDPEALERAQPAISSLPVTVAVGNYTDIPQILRQLEIDAVDGILLDLGLSSDQLADEERGFSFQSTGPLDLRFDRSSGKPAWQLIERLSERHLADLIYQFGEERLSRRIARKIVAQRRSEPIRTADQLASLVRSCVPRSRGHRIDPATRTFQALRIAVNDELKSLQEALAHLPTCLKPGGHLAIISFHSLEDRLVKHGFRNDDRLEVLTKRPVRATDEETAQNPRASSAKLRIAKRVD